MISVTDVLETVVRQVFVVSWTQIYFFIRCHAEVPLNHRRLATTIANNTAGIYNVGELLYSLSLEMDATEDEHTQTRLKV